MEIIGECFCRKLRDDLGLRMGTPDVAQSKRRSAQRVPPVLTELGKDGTQQEQHIIARK
jgi:hypothetical protein